MELINHYSLEDYLPQYVNSLCPGSTDLEIYSDEVISELIRLVSCSLCPCSKIKVQNTVIDLIEELFPDGIDAEIRVKDILENLIILGDLLELPPINDDALTSRNQVYLSPLKYVKINDDRILLLGVDHNILDLPSEIRSKIKYEKSLKIIGNDDLNIFKEFDYTELSSNEWLRFEKYSSSQEYVNLINAKLESLPILPERLDGIRILDDKIGTNFYKSRWSELNRKHNGFFVGRRKVQYSSDLWCYMQVNDNFVQRFLDLPILDLHWRPFDEAWRLQMAIDYNNHAAQKYRISEVLNEVITIDFFSPIPGWAVRQLEVNGKKCEPNQCLFSYSINKVNIEKIEEFLKSNLWMQRINKKIV